MFRVSYFVFMTHLLIHTHAHTISLTDTIIHNHIHQSVKHSHDSPTDVVAAAAAATTEVAAAAAAAAASVVVFVVYVHVCCLQCYLRIKLLKLLCYCGGPGLWGRFGGGPCDQICFVKDLKTVDSLVCVVVIVVLLVELHAHKHIVVDCWLGEGPNQ